MSLLYWLPMLGDLKNQGLSDATPVNHGASVNNSGKLGKCYSFSGSSQYIDTGFKESISTGDFTISAWVKLTSDTTKTYQPIISNKTTAANSVGFAIYFNHNQNKFLWSTADGTNATEIWTTNTFANVYNTWTHVVMVRNSSDPKIGYFYINGERQDLASVPPVKNITNATYNMIIGDIATHNNAAYMWTGDICDVRIYNEAISPKLAKELSKGLVLHYPLNREGFGADNLIIDTLKDRGNSHATYNIADFNFSEALVSGDTYTVSAKVNASSEKKGICFYHSGGSYQMGSWMPINDTGIYTATFTATDAMASRTGGVGYGYCRVYVSNNTSIQGSTPLSGTANVEWIKVEKGGVATPWTPNPADTLYSAMGMDDGIEYDCSGYKHNGEKIGALTYTSDTPRYHVSTHISETTQKIHIPNLTTVGFGDSYSFAWWGKRSSNSPMFWGFSDGIRLNGMYLGTLWNTGDSSNNPLYNIGTTTQVTAPSTGVWHHYVMTGNGTKCYVYLDGELWAEAKTYKAISGTSIYINGWDSSTTYCSNYTSISDFRIYSTALDADSVRSLYNTAASIASNGTILTYELEEV